MSHDLCTVQTEPSACFQVLIHPTDKQKTTVDQVNNNAPAYSVPGVRPLASCALFWVLKLSMACALTAAHCATAKRTPPIIQIH